MRTTENPNAMYVDADQGRELIWQEWAPKVFTRETLSKWLGIDEKVVQGLRFPCVKITTKPGDHVYLLADVMTHLETLKMWSEKEASRG